jgi:hypothetical protein
MVVELRSSVTNDVSVADTPVLVVRPDVVVEVPTEVVVDEFVGEVLFANVVVVDAIVVEDNDVDEVTPEVAAWLCAGPPCNSALPTTAATGMTNHDQRVRVCLAPNKIFTSILG